MYNHTEESKRLLTLNNESIQMVDDIDNIFEMSSRSRAKIILKMYNDGLLECSNCGWDVTICDIHHIKGKKIENPDHHSNLSYLCPNCHRMAHNGLLQDDQLVTLEKTLGDLWKSYSYKVRKRKTKEEIQKEKEMLIERKHKRKQDTENKIQLVKQSDIDFSKFGWAQDLSNLIGITPQKCRNWMKRNIPHIKLYKRKSIKR